MSSLGSIGANSPRSSPPPVQTTSDSAIRFPASNIKVVLFEKISKQAADSLREQGYSVQEIPSGYSEDQLLEMISDVHVVGIRSKTKITKKVLEAAKKLMCIGCFCIGTDQVDLAEATLRGIPVFNSPYGNTRSVSELVIAEIIMLARQAGDRSNELHRGEWNKISSGCYEVRNKTLGIIGYGHVGSQLSILAEALGMRVVFYDVVPKLALGSAQQQKSMEDVLSMSDFVSLHVPADPSTINLITEKEINLMRKHSYLINASRGKVVDVKALAAALKSGHLAGAAVDVFPQEPAGHVLDFKSELQNCPNTILTPHIGGSTEEAQLAIGIEVASKIADFVNRGVTLGSVNTPNVSAKKSLAVGHTRVLCMHKNTPGVMREINRILSGANIASQNLETGSGIGYLIVDLESETSEEINNALNTMPHNIRSRMLYRGEGYQGGPV